jgi:hypothetical protein
MAGVSFLWPGSPPDLAPERVDEHPDAFRSGEEAWILQTCLRLQAAGRPAALVPEAPAGGILVYHARQERRIAHLRRPGGPLLVAVRGERSRPLLAHVEVVQNGRGADGRRRYFLPHWPQPGLVPRQAGRGEHLQRLVYKGFPQNLHPDFTGPAWRDALCALGIDWCLDTGSGWHDYSQVDAVLAIRPGGYKTRLKPATKLVNAWLAGVPAILGREPAYRELGRRGEDYLEAVDSGSALVAVRALLRDDRYLAYVGRGAARAPELAVPRTRERWERLLYATLPSRADELARRPPRRRRLLPFGRRGALAQ